MNQLNFLRLNLTGSGASVLLFAFLWATIGRFVMRTPALFLGSALCLINLAWIAVFRNHVQIHHYAQWFFVPAIPLICGGCAAMSTDWFGTSSLGRRPVFVALILATGSSLLLGQLALKQALEASTFAKVDDVETLLSLDRRLLTFDNGWSGPEVFWENGMMDLYLDPVYRRSDKVGRTSLHSVDVIRPDKDAIVIRKADDYQSRLAPIAQQLRLRPLAESSSFLFLEATRPIAMSKDPTSKDPTLSAGGGSR